MTTLPARNSNRDRSTGRRANEKAGAHPQLEHPVAWLVPYGRSAWYGPSCWMNAGPGGGALPMKAPPGGNTRPMPGPRVLARLLVERFTRAQAYLRA